MELLPYICTVELSRESGRFHESLLPDTSLQRAQTRLCGSTTALNPGEPMQSTAITIALLERSGYGAFSISRGKICHDPGCNFAGPRH